MIIKTTIITPIVEAERIVRGLTHQGIREFAKISVPFSTFPEDIVAHIEIKVNKAKIAKIIPNKSLTFILIIHLL